MDDMKGKMTRLMQEAIRQTELPVLEIARQAGISQGQLSRFIRDERTLTLPIAERLCEVLGLELHRIGVARRAILKPPHGRSNVDHTKYEVRISDTVIKPYTFKNHALFAAVKYLCEQRKPMVTPEAVQRASGL